jgi:hypothetical protein
MLDAGNLGGMWNLGISIFPSAGLFPVGPMFAKKIRLSLIGHANGNVGFFVVLCGRLSLSIIFSYDIGCSCCC